MQANVSEANVLTVRAASSGGTPAVSPRRAPGPNGVRNGRATSLRQVLVCRGIIDSSPSCPEHLSFLKGFIYYNLSMLLPEYIEVRLERILLKVQKPGRYVGGELNTVTKDWNKVRTKVALVFPDIYDIGVSNVGLKILYDEINGRRDALAERAYAPWTDMEALMRAQAIPLYSLESKRPLSGFDLIGFSLPYETLYTNTLNLLDLAGVPVRAAERAESHPIIIAGGHAATNPEPMHAFMDAFVIGEGEEVIHDILDAIQANAAREDKLRALAKIPGVYVPKYYRVHYMDDGTLSHVETLLDGIANPIVKRIVAQLPPPPTKFIVPNIEVVHNRVSVEIMRGDRKSTRFCQAGMITRPVRERSLGEIVAAAEEAINATGFEELALLSLSSSDFSRAVELVNKVRRRVARQYLDCRLGLIERTRR